MTLTIPGKARAIPGKAQAIPGIWSPSRFLVFKKTVELALIIEKH